MINNVITYEQPLNELIRVCLRLEQLFLQMDHWMTDSSVFGARQLLVTLINTLQLLDRPDLKAKLVKELGYQLSVLSRLKKTTSVDISKLDELLKQLDELSRCFIDSSGKIGQRLREIELLNTLRLHLTTPGSGASFDIPLYHYWLQQPAAQKTQTIQSWIKELDKIRIANGLVLKLVREESKTEQKQAANGFHQELLDPQVNLRLIRLMIPKDIEAYPEISIGRHFLSIRFFTPTILERPSQYLDHLSFGISYCTS